MSRRERMLRALDELLAEHDELMRRLADHELAEKTSEKPTREEALAWARRGAPSPSVLAWSGEPNEPVCSTCSYWGTGSVVAGKCGRNQGEIYCYCECHREGESKPSEPGAVDVTAGVFGLVGDVTYGELRIRVQAALDAADARGREAERRAVVEWLRGGHRRSPRPGPDEATDILRAQVFADQIERGEHLEP